MSIWLILSGKLGKILHPRMIPWIIAASVLFLALAVSDARKIRVKPAAGSRVMQLLPLIFAVAVVALDAGSDQQPAGRMDNSPRYVEPAKLESAADLPARISFSDDDYWKVLNILYDDPKGAQGKTLTVQGFVYRDKSLPSGGVIVGRNLMWCCSADLAVVGFLAEGANLASFKNDAWVEVTGTLAVADFDITGGGKPAPSPVIAITSIKEVPKGPSTTIYPS